MKLNDCIQTIHRVIQTIGPATARSIESHPDVRQACQATKTKARTHIEKLVSCGRVKSSQEQMATYW